MRICSDALSSILSVNTFADAYFPLIVFNVFSFLIQFYSRFRTMSPVLFSNPIPCLAGHAKLLGGIRDRENALLHLLMENVKKVSIILGGFAAFPVIRALTGNLLALSGAFNNHVTLKLCKGKHHRANQFAGRRVIHHAHVQNVHGHVFCKQAVNNFNTALHGTSNTVKLRHDQRVSRMNFIHQLIKFRAMQLRAGVNIRKDFLCAVGFQKFRLGFKAVAINRLSSGTDTSVTVNHSGSPSFSTTVPSTIYALSPISPMSGSTTMR
nr:MAG TPA: hypothetical protein [Caudoviricetes sp.]